MHPNPVFHTKDAAENLAFARDRAFGMLTVNGDHGPVIAHVPFVLSDDGKHADLHLVRSNPISRMLAQPLRAVIAVSGPDGYVSPDWYGVPDQVPTWNYVAVHLAGFLEARPVEELPDTLARQSADLESRLAPKPEWTLDKMDEAARTRMMRMILPCRLIIETVEGTWKLSQNKPSEAQIGAAEGLEQVGFGVETDMLARLMRGG